MRKKFLSNMATEEQILSRARTHSTEYEDEGETKTQSFSYVLPEEIKVYFSDEEFDNLAKFMDGQTGPMIGDQFAFYTDDVLRFIKGLPNID